MKKMACKQLGGACDEVFYTDTFEQMAELSKQHGMQMFQAGDEAHLQAMDKMKMLMENPEEMNAWFEGKQMEFEHLPDEKSSH
jgi:hypothetical protein